jgi:hypothetical protein
MSSSACSLLSSSVGGIVSGVFFDDLRAKRESRGIKDYMTAREFARSLAAEMIWFREELWCIPTKERVVEKTTKWKKGAEKA